MKKKIFDLPEMYVERAEGTAEWYFGTDFEEDICDLYEAEEMVKEGGIFTGKLQKFCTPCLLTRWRTVII